MNFRHRERGATLVVVLLCLFIFMTMIIGFTYDARSQSALNAGVKLHNFYRVTGEQVLNEVRGTLADYWVIPLEFEDPTNMNKWRFGSLLQGDFSVSGETSQYGVLFSDGSIAQNGGILNLDYKVFVGNNADDPAHYLKGIKPLAAEDFSIDETWDTDGKIVMTVQVFQQGDVFPLSTVSHMIAVSGWDALATVGDVGSEGSDYGLDNTGRGTAGADGTLDLFEDVTQNVHADVTYFP